MNICHYSRADTPGCHCTVKETEPDIRTVPI